MLLASLISAGSVFGRQIVTLEFSFSNPGARSMALGGAFVALADDATTTLSKANGASRPARVGLPPNPARPDATFA